MDNLLTTLAFSLHSNKGTYAFLLGSGASAPSGIPTGWAVLMDLIIKLAAMHGEEISDPEVWYVEKYKKAPDYSEILSNLVTTQTERVNLLRPYFEPTSEERENGLKEPTKAHIAIAKMAAKGYVKVILTTNFDRLLEKAFEAEGITPQVIYHEDDITGAIPLVHAQCTIIKINGDYIDCRFLNTHEELSTYSERWKDYLNKIFDDFGLITSGWSAKWDKGLIDLIRGCPNHRYASYFTYKADCENELKELCNFRKGKSLEVPGADMFFSELNDRLETLESIISRHPLTKDMAVARVKKYIAKPENKVLLYDLFEQESHLAQDKINQTNGVSFQVDAPTFSFFWNLHKEAVDVLVPMCITAVQWSDKNNEDMILQTIRRVIQPHRAAKSYSGSGDKLHYLAGYILYYVVGICCIHFDKYRLLRKIFEQEVPSFGGVRREKLINLLAPNSFDKGDLNTAIGANWIKPLSSFLDKNLWDYFISIFDSKDEFTYAFDIFEYLISLNYLNICGQSFGSDWVPCGLYHWRNYNYNPDNPKTNFFAQAEKLKDNWHPIKEGGMFNASYETYVDIKKRADTCLQRYSNRW